MLNPYESPNTPADDHTASPTPFLTQRRVFWFAIGLVIAATIVFTGNQSLFAELRGGDGVWSAFVFIVDCAAGYALLTGLSLLVVYHWFPDPGRKYKWRGKQPRGNRED